MIKKTDIVELIVLYIDKFYLIQFQKEVSYSKKEGWVIPKMRLSYFKNLKMRLSYSKNWGWVISKI